MELLVRKLWFGYDVKETMDAFFEIPQAGEIFDQGYRYESEMRPLGVKVGDRLYSASGVLEKIEIKPNSVCLVLTSMDLQGDHGRIYGKGYDGKTIISNDAWLSGYDNNIFDPSKLTFQSTVLHEVGHALGLDHHEYDPRELCVMPTRPDVEWGSLDKISFCNDCYSSL